MGQAQGFSPGFLHEEPRAEALSLSILSRTGEKSARGSIDKPGW
jgi:hypothetical protein